MGSESHVSLLCFMIDWLFGPWNSNSFVKTLDGKNWMTHLAWISLYTGCTIRIWHNVETCLDQSLWHIYQKLMFSGFLSRGHLCLINHLILFWPHIASTASDRKGAKIQHEFSWFCQKKKNFKTLKKVILVLRLLKSRTWMTMKSSVVIFWA